MPLQMSDTANHDYVEWKNLMLSVCNTAFQNSRAV